MNLQLNVRNANTLCTRFQCTSDELRKRCGAKALQEKAHSFDQAKGHFSGHFGSKMMKVDPELGRMRAHCEFFQANRVFTSRDDAQSAHMRAEWRRIDPFSNSQNCEFGCQQFQQRQQKFATPPSQHPNGSNPHNGAAVLLSLCLLLSHEALCWWTACSVALCLRHRQQQQQM